MDEKKIMAMEALYFKDLPIEEFPALFRTRNDTLESEINPDTEKYVLASMLSRIVRRKDPKVLKELIDEYAGWRTAHDHELVVEGSKKGSIDTAVAIMDAAQALDAGIGQHTSYVEINYFRPLMRVLHDKYLDTYFNNYKMLAIKFAHPTHAMSDKDKADFRLGSTNIIYSFSVSGDIERMQIALRFAHSIRDTDMQILMHQAAKISDWGELGVDAEWQRLPVGRDERFLNSAYDTKEISDLLYRSGVKPPN